MKSSNKMASDFFKVVLSNATVLASSIITALIIPKLMGASNYGYYKVYTLYMSYTALFHFGFVDGVLLKHAGQEYDTLDKKVFRLNTKFYITFQAVVSIIIAFVSVLFFSGVYRFVVFAIAVDTFSTNVTTYYQFVSQSTMRFNELSKRKILYAIFKLCATGLIILVYRAGYISEVPCQLYIGAIIFINAILMLWYVFTYRDITFGKYNNFHDSWKLLRDYFVTGISLTLAFQVANLVLSLDQQFVSLLFDSKTYGIYAFAYSILNMATTVMGAASMALFPNLKRRGVDTIERDMPMGIAVISMMVFAGHLFYYPLNIFVKYVLPEYLPSLVYFRIIFPGLALSSSISAIMFNYYKVLNRQRRYCCVCLFVLMLSAALNAIAYWIFRTPESISAASIITLIVWYISAIRSFVKQYNVKWIKELLYILVMGGGFYIITSIVGNGFVAGALLYMVLYFIVTLILYHELIFSFFQKLLKKN